MAPMHYYDSGSIEGIGFYSEEMMLQSGLYEDSPHSRDIVYNQMRLRALRVIADVQLALGMFTPQAAADFMQRNVPMSVEDARTEARMNPMEGSVKYFLTSMLVCGFSSNSPMVYSLE